MQIRTSLPSETTPRMLRFTYGMGISLIPRWLKTLIKRSALLVSLNASLRWKFHLLKDWWGTKVWTRTHEVITPLGFKLTSGFHPAYELMRTGRFEIDETALICRLLENVDQFVDVGANLGYYTCLALKAGRPVLAFEPQQQNLQCLFQNLQSNGWPDRAEIFPLALSDQPGLLSLYGASGPSASLVKHWAGYSSRHSRVVPVNTLDNVLAGRFPDQRLLIKIDVEGAEYRVLSGARATLTRRVKPLWIIEICLQEFHPEGRNPDFGRIFELFFENGYTAYTATAPPRLVTTEDVLNWLGGDHAGSGTFNYVFCAAEQNVFER